MNPDKHSYGLLVLSLVWLVGMLLLIPVDYDWTIWLRQHRLKWLDHWMDQTLFEGEGLGGGDPIIILLLVTVIAYYLAWKKGETSKFYIWRPHLGFILVSALVNSLMMVHSLKWIMGRARPSLVLKGLFPYSDWFVFGPHFITEGIYRGSFPSGHTAQVFTLVTIAYVLVISNPKLKHQVVLGWVWGGFAMLYTLCMGLTRCMKLSHWLSDILFTIGISWILMVFIYHHLLRIPQQEAYYREHGGFPEISKVWDLRLCLSLFGTVVGAVLLLFGLRALIGDVSMLITLALLTSGLLLLFLFGRHTDRSHKKLRRALTRSDVPPLQESKS